MAFKLTKAQKDERSTLNAKMQEAHDELTSATNAYNEALSALRDWTQTIAGDMRSEFDDKSEKWQGGDKGSEVESWIQEWENIEFPDDLDEPDDTFFNAVVDLSEEAGG